MMTTYNFSIEEIMRKIIFYNIPLLATSFFKKKTRVEFFIMQNFLGILVLLSNLLDLFIRNQTL